MSVIKSKKFILRPFKKDDAVSLTRNINNKKIYRNTLSIPYPYVLNDARKWLKKCRESKSDKEKNWVIDIKGEVVGGVGLRDVDGHKAEIGYWLAEAYWGRGITTEAVKLVVKYCFNRLKLRRLYAYVFPRNQASLRVLFKAGFKKEGLLKKNVVKNGKFFNDVLLAKVR